MSAPTPPPSTDGATRVAAPTVPSQAEVTQKAKRMGIGIGLVGGAGVVALLGVSALVTAAGVVGLIATLDVDQAKPPLPTETIASVQADLDTVKKGISR
jgi:hypothetical protein